LRKPQGPQRVQSLKIESTTNPGAAQRKGRNEDLCDLLPMPWHRGQGGRERSPCGAVRRRGARARQNGRDRDVVPALPRRARNAIGAATSGRGGLRKLRGKKSQARKKRRVNEKGALGHFFIGWRIQGALRERHAKGEAAGCRGENRTPAAREGGPIGEKEKPPRRAVSRGSRRSRSITCPACGARLPERRRQRPERPSSRRGKP
jgi:hypothetical protein